MHFVTSSASLELNLRNFDPFGFAADQLVNAGDALADHFAHPMAWWFDSPSYSPYSTF